MSANDCGTLAGIKCELDWIPKVVEAGVPYPRPLPRRPAADPRRRRPGRPASRGQGRDRLCRHRADRSRPRVVPGPMKVYQWHREGMTLPACCELLATNDTYPVQGFRCGDNAFGFQFHPEVTLEMKRIWTLSAVERLKLPGAQQRGVHLCMHPLYDPPIDRWINRFLDRWLASDKRQLSSEPVKPSDHRPANRFSPPNSAASDAIVPPRCLGYARPNLSGGERMGALIFVVALVIVALVLVFAGVKTVNAGHQLDDRAVRPLHPHPVARPAFHRAVRRHGRPQDEHAGERARHPARRRSSPRTMPPSRSTPSPSTR